MDENSIKLCKSLITLFIRFYGIIFIVFAISSGAYFMEDFLRYNARINYSGNNMTQHLLWLGVHFFINLFFGIALLINTDKWIQLISKGVFNTENSNQMKIDTKENQ